MLREITVEKEENRQSYGDVVAKKAFEVLI